MILRNAPKLAAAGGGLLFLILAGLITGNAHAKSLYVITNINANPTPVASYDIQPGPVELFPQGTTTVPRFGGGGVGMAIDTASATLFITYEFVNTIQLVNANTFADLGTTTAPGATNLAGIVVDQGRSRVYAIDRNTNHLYVYDWVPPTLTLVGASFVNLTGVSGAYGLALDEIRDRLYVGDDTAAVKYFDASTLTTSNPVPLDGSVDTSAEGQSARGVAVDSLRNLLYTGEAFGGPKLVKYDLNTDTTSSYTLGASDFILGIAVDEDTGKVYATTGYQTDTLIAFDSSLNVLKNDLGDLGNPTGLAVPRADIAFGLLNLTKDDFPDPVSPGTNLTYTICYDNLANATAVNNVTIVDTLPPEATFVSATGNPTVGVGTVTWNVGTVAAGAQQVCFSLTVIVNAQPDTLIVNFATIDSDETSPTTRTQTTTVMGDPFGQALEAIEIKLDTLGPQVQALESKLDTLGPEVGAIEAKLDAMEGKSDALEAKADASGMKLDDEFMRDMEKCMLFDDRIAFFYLPQAQGGHLEDVKRKVIDTRSAVIASGESVPGGAAFSFQNGVQFERFGKYKRAFSFYATAYCQLVSLPGEPCPR